MQARLRLTRRQILAFRRRVGGLDERVPTTAASLRRAAWAGLQDSMPRAALLSLHARLVGVEPSTWETPSLVQVRGPRYSTYVVAERDFALFTLARLPERGKSRARAEQIAERLRVDLDGGRTTDREAGLAIRANPRYAAPTGTVAIRWEGARAPTIWTVPAPGSSRPTPVANWHGGTCMSSGRRAMASPGGRGSRGARGGRLCRAGGLAAARPLAARGGVAPAQDEPRCAPPRGAPALARLLPSGYAYFLLHGVERELLVPRADRRELLWTSRVWPGALLVEGEIRGTWRRAQHTVRIDAWGRPPRVVRDAVDAEAAALPLPGLDRVIDVLWNL